MEYQDDETEDGEPGTDPALSAAIAAHLAAQDAGQPIPWEELLARFPTVQEPLREFLQKDQRIRALTQGAGAAPPSPLSRGSFAGYEILGVQGRGGNGVVYSARQRSPERVVALKVLDGYFPDGTCGCRDGREEATYLARLDHPGILPVYEAGTFNGVPYFSQKLVVGGTLAQHRERIGLDPAVVARMLEKVARAVHHAHERGVLHRDLKPSNILLGEDDEPHVADFGLARLLAPDHAATLTRGVGSPDYMAPEQVDGRPEAFAATADIFSLGAIIYELLAGVKPFEAPSVHQTIHQVLHEDPKPPGKLRVGVPRDLETIALKCLAKEPQRRYATAKALADDLGRFLDGEPILARPPRLLERGARWVRRHRALAALLGVLALALLALGWMRLDHRREIERVEQEKSQRVRELAILESIARRFDLADRLRKTEAALHEQRFDLARHFLRTARQIETPGAKASFVTRHLDLQSQQFLRDVPFLPEDVHAIGHVQGIDALLLVAQGDNNTVVRPFAGLENGSVVVSGRDCFALSPDGAHLVMPTSSQSVDVFRVQEASLVPPFDFWRPEGRQLRTDEITVAIVFDPRQATRVLLAGQSGEVRSWDLATRERGGTVLGRAVLGGAGPLRTLIAAPSSRELLGAHEDGKVRIWSLGDDDEALPAGELAGHTGAVVALSLSPDGRRVASAGADGTLRLWDLPGRAQVGLGKAAAGALRAVAISPDARLVAAAGDDRLVAVFRLPDASAASGGELELLHRFCGHSATIHALWFDPVKPRLISAGERTEALFWDLERLQNPQLLRNPFAVDGPEEVIWGVCWQRGTNRFLTLDETGVVRAFVLEGPEPCLVRAGPSYRDWQRDGRLDPALAPDGLRLAVPFRDGNVEVWRLPSLASTATGAADDGRPRLESILSNRHEARIVVAGFAEDSSLLATADEEEVIHLWARTESAAGGSWHQTARLRVQLNPHTSGMQSFDDPDSLVFSRDRRFLAAACRSATDVALWRLDAAGRVESDRPATSNMGDKTHVLALAFTPDGRHLIAGTRDHKIRFQEVAALLTGTPAPVGTSWRWELDEHDAAVTTLTFTPDGKYLISGTDDGEVRFWDVIAGSSGVTGLRLSSWRETGRRISGVVFSPDDSVMVTAGGVQGAPGDVRVWRTRAE